MTGLRGILRDIDRIEREKYAIPPPDRAGKGKRLPDEEKPPERNDDENLRLILLLLIRWKDFLSPFIRKRRDPSSHRFLQEAAPLLHELRSLLLELEHKDLSHDPAFLSHLSRIWNKLCQVNVLPGSATPHEERLLNILSSIEKYPKGEQFNLGFYLHTVVGEIWHPFPLMDMLSQLHHEAQADKMNSSLTKWHQALTALLF
jgi:hypothetical protein